MIIEERKNHELDLESVDKDLRMEKVRQSSEKLQWDHFSKSVRRNLLEKRYALDARTRLDLLSSLDFMRQNMPIDETTTVAQKVKQLADSLGIRCIVSMSPAGFLMRSADVTIEIGVVEEKITSCKMGYFGQPLFDAPDALALMKANKFTDLRYLSVRYLFNR
ncbi:unnamed protein product [Caenorhabditis sp. 36 PRJEB53466]|nr:unnamed protein product [Caenorhabditis sp. 36 PRJEB53466]